MTEARAHQMTRRIPVKAAGAALSAQRLPPVKLGNLQQFPLAGNQLNFILSVRCLASGLSCRPDVPSGTIPVRIRTSTMEILAWCDAAFVR